MCNLHFFNTFAHEIDVFGILITATNIYEEDPIITHCLHGILVCFC